MVTMIRRRNKKNGGKNDRCLRLARAENTIKVLFHKISLLGQRLPFNWSWLYIDNVFLAI